ncbi:MAG: GTPase ObgE [bacterium]|nr:GTPase ObgE [bacterium]
MLIDDITIDVKAGKGGHGIAVFSRTKMTLGPTGGNGGRGGDVYLEGTEDIGALRVFRFQKNIIAHNGGEGRQKLRDGKKGDDTVCNVPVGTVVYNLTTDERHEITGIGERVIVARGGEGGRGNFVFRSSTNTTPEEHEEGKEGEEAVVRLELKLIADIGIIGLPNAGKSSLLNELTRASSKVANYPFTTLEPSLGVHQTLILADIPGIIEGASAGKGLGLKFLRHIERTSTLLHLVSAESFDPVKDYEVIRMELENHNKNLLQKEEHVFLSKSDLLSANDLEAKILQLKKVGIFATPLSSLSEQGFDRLKSILNNEEAKKQGK